MKFENNWRFKSLDSLEKVNWGEPNFDSYLVKTCHRLRKVPLNEFEIEDLRIMIGQDIGLEFLIPIAIEELEKDILAEGHLYEGDLFHAVTSSDPEYWKTNRENWKKIHLIFENNLELLESYGSIDRVKKDWFPNLDEFLKIHS
jgi:hypothetical protein